MVQLSAYDDDGDAVEFSLVNDTAGPFSLTTSGLLYVDTSKGWLDYERVQVYNLSVRVREVSNRVSASPLLNASQGYASEVIRVLDVREAPYFVNAPWKYYIDEESVYPTMATPRQNGSFIMVSDEDVGNNSALAVSVSSMVNGVAVSYFEVVNSSGSACLGGMTCVLRVRSDSPRMNYDAPSSLRMINVTLTVSDSTGLSSSTSQFNVTVVDINQGR